jgi:N-acetylglucosamine malate deacetylase 1
MKNALIFTAHDDDEILGMGGTIQSLKKLEFRIFVCQITDGSSTQYKNDKSKIGQRKKQHEKALAILNIDEVIELGLPDMKLDTLPHHEINDAMNGALHKVKPGYVFTHYAKDINKDHREAGYSTDVITRGGSAFLEKVFAYEVLSSTEWQLAEPFSPNCFVDIAPHIKNKISAMEAMETEIRDFPHPRSAQGIETLARYRGMQSGYEYAEAFMLVKSFIL